jgi:CheY-like chemotaxis protein
VLANSGEEALVILSSDDKKFDLVLTDMQMPYMDGIHLAEAIREKYPDIPIVLLSSIGDEYNQANLQMFSSILTKPVRQHVLCKHILCALQNNHQASNEVTVQKKLAADFALQNPLEILIAEDNLVNQQVILHILNKLGYQPQLAENGLEALEAATQKQFDLILMDMQMPEMDGMEATRAIRSTLKIQPVIIALTANTMQGDEEECLNAGMNDYIGKPVKLEDLVHKLEKWSVSKKAGEEAA